MATMAELLVGQAGQGITVPRANIADSVVQGAQLAQHAQQIAQEGEKLQQAKAQAAQLKWEKVGDAFGAAAKMEPGAAKKAFVGEYIPNMINALGMKDSFNPTSLKMLQSDDNLAALLQDKLKKREITMEQLNHAAQDPEYLASFMKDASQYGSYNNYKTTFEGNIGELSKAAEFGTKAADALERTKITAAASAMKGNAIESRAETAKDEQAANAVKAVTHDDKIASFTVQHNNINRDLGMLLKTPHPSVTQIKEMAQGFAAAYAGGKGLSSDFKVKEISTETLEGKVAEAVNFSASDPDHTPAPEKVVEFWKKTGLRLKEAYQEQIATQAKLLKKELPLVYAHNPAALKAGNSRADSYIDGTWSGGPKQYDIFGTKMPAEQAKAFFKQHPQVSAPPDLKKELGL